MSPLTAFILFVVSLPCIFILWKYLLLPFFVKYRFTIGYISKISALSGVNVALLESQRWTFIRNPHSPSDSSTSDIVIVAFAGAALLVGGTPRIEFSKTLSQFNADQLFLMDPKQSWYLNDAQDTWGGYEYHENKLKEFLEKYKKVIFVGASMGASATLMFSHLADYVIAFSPQTHPIIHDKYPMRFNARRMPKYYQECFLEILTKNINNSRGVVHVYIGSLPADVKQANLLPPKVIIHQISECKDHTLPSYLRKQNKLVPIIAEAVESMQMDLN